MDEIEYSLNPPSPFRLDLTVWVLRRRPTNRIDSWDGKTWRRVLLIGGCPVLAAVEQISGPDSPRLSVSLFAEKMPEGAERESRGALIRILGVDTDLSGFYSMVAADPDIGPLAKRFVGMRPPRYPSLFEAVANGIIGQQISLYAAMSILNRFAEALGRPFQHSGTTFCSFPGPSDLLSVDSNELRALGLSAGKARALVECARAIDSGGLAARMIESSDNAAASVLLSSHRGIGAWTADYILLRGFGRLDIFPRNDSGALKNLARRLARSPRDQIFSTGQTPEGPPAREFLESAIVRWRPYAGLVYFHLLLSGLFEESIIE